MTTVEFKRPERLELSERAYDLVVKALKSYSATLLTEAKLAATTAERQIDIRMDRADLATLIERLGG
jgi:histone H3/H4